MKRKNFLQINMIMVCGFMIVIGGFAILKSSIFNLKFIEVECEQLNEEEILENLNITKGKNIFSYYIKEIKNEVKKNPYVLDCSVKIKLPSTLKIQIQEIKAIACLRNENKYCYITKNIDKIEDVVDIKDCDKMIIDIKYESSENYIEFENDEIKNRLTYLLELLDNKNLNKKICEINFLEEENINLLTTDYTKVILPNDENLDYNISRLNKIIIDLQNKNKKNGTIDLTYNNYALYNPKD
jgi:cell division protein FtsQ